MVLFGGILSVKAITYLLFFVFSIAAVGYLLGRITIKGVSLGTAGVFIIALLAGAFFYKYLDAQLMLKAGDVAKSYTNNALKVVENMGLILFVTSVGFIAGPNFIGNFKKNFTSYVMIALVVILMGGLSCAGCIIFDNKMWGSERTIAESAAMLVGLLSGSLTSTPAFSAAKETAGEALENIVSVGHGIAYLYGVVGVVLFVQIIPKILGANMAEERKKIVVADDGSSEKKSLKNLIEIDGFGFMAFSAAAVLGIILGSIKVFGFNLTTTGGCLVIALMFGHFARIGSISITPKTETLKVFRELGLMLFLIGAGIPGGANFVKYFEGVYFIYGIIMTTLPMIAGYFFAKYVLKLSLLNNLGSITGGMTSTPALGTLINTAGTEDVASAYASTYPVALISVVIVSKVLIMMFN
ncbi:MAG: permease [Treponema sp.]|nr:permease [Treponema sp.]